MTMLDRLNKWPTVATKIGIAVGFALMATPASAENDDLRKLIINHHLAFIPEGEGHFPTLIAIPGCSGIAFKDPEKEISHPDLREDDRLFRRHYSAISKRLSEAGFAVLLINIHEAESVVTACRGEIAAERIAAYIDEAAAWAPTLGFADPERIHLIGWSMGGGGALSWMNGPRRAADAISSVIAVYPACNADGALTLRKPLLMLLGEADDIAPPAVCKDLAARSATKDMITIRSYPGARHGFDIVDAPPVLEIGGGMTVGGQPEAAEAAWREIIAFLDG